MTITLTLSFKSLEMNLFYHENNVKKIQKRSQKRTKRWMRNILPSKECERYCRKRDHQEMNAGVYQKMTENIILRSGRPLLVYDSLHDCNLILLADD